MDVEATTEIEELSPRTPCPVVIYLCEAKRQQYQHMTQSPTSSWPKEKMDSDNKYGNESNESYSYQTYNIFAYIIGILFSPLLGVIMGIVGVIQRKKNAWHIIIISILGWVLNVFVINNL